MEANYLISLGLNIVLIKLLGGVNEIMHVKHLTQSLAHTKILVVVDDFLKKMTRTVPSNYQIPQTHMIDLLLFTRGSLFHSFLLFYVLCSWPPQ